MKYFEMFTGIAGFSKGIERAYAKKHGQGRMPECIGFSEIGKVANGILRYRYPEVTNYGDAAGIVCDELPGFDFLCGGFPCQAFSIAGKRQGFNDTRGTLFFEIARILSHKRPGHFLLENVEGLRSHEEGKTLQEILGILAELDYRVEVVLLNSKHYGVPQNRERVFFIGHLGSECSREILSFGDGNSETVPAGPVGIVSGTISTKNQSGQCNFDGSTTLVVGEEVSFTLDGHYYKGASPQDMERGMKRQMILHDQQKGMIKAGTLRTHNVERYYDKVPDYCELYSVCDARDYPECDGSNCQLKADGKKCPEAVRYETSLQAAIRSTRLSGTPYLHRSCVPLGEIDFDKQKNQPSLFGNECEGVCGV